MSPALPRPSTPYSEGEPMATAKKYYVEFRGGHWRGVRLIGAGLCALCSSTTPIGTRGGRHSSRKRSSTILQIRSPYWGSGPV